MDGANGFVWDARAQRVDISLPWNRVTEAGEAAEAIGTRIVRRCTLIANVGSRPGQHKLVEPVV